MPKKVLLALFPFWTPQIPPLGISCLKGFLRQHHAGPACPWQVKTADANIEIEFKDVYNSYFKRLKDYIPREQQGNFHNIGHDVLRFHMMAHINYTGENHYTALVKELVYKTFNVNINRRQVSGLIEVIREFYTRFEAYLLALLEKERPAVLGISVYSGTLPASLFAFKKAKEIYPHLQTVMGGGVFSDQLNPQSPDFRYFLDKTPYIDHFIIGEGELLFLKLLKGELGKLQRVIAPADINHESLDLSRVDIPDFSGFELGRYPHLAAYTSRSCPFQCGFCSETLQWGKYRKKNATQVVEELTKLYQKHDSRLFLMGDSLLNPVVTELARVFQKKDITLYWDGYLRVEKAVGDTDNTLHWRQGGFYRARLGLESGSRRILEMMDKKITCKQIASALFALSYAGIKTTTYWVIGYPGETEEDFQQTLNLLEELKNYIYEAECNPFHYSITGQVNSLRWAAENQTNPLFTDTPYTKEMLMIRPWIMDCLPSREETYQRMRRFVRFCRQLGIPNPYSLEEIHKADERWKQLHANAVPSLAELRDKTIPGDESKHIQHLFVMETPGLDDDNFGF